MTVEGPDSRQQSLEPAIIVGHGARATEELLLRDLAQLLEARPEGSIPARPIRIIVSSRPLRDHVAATISRDLPPARIGVVCQTLPSVARQILAAAGDEEVDAGALIPLLARRAARRFPALHDVLEPLSDGYGTVVGSVRDLLDAGFDPALADGLEEALTTRALQGAGRHEVDRAIALIGVAGAVSAVLDSLGRVSPAGLYQRSALRLRQSGPGQLPSTFIFFHGWADATGAATDLIEAILAEVGGRFYLDLPYDPLAPGQPDAGETFTKRLAERLELALPRRIQTPGNTDPCELRVASKIDIESETRMVAEQVRGLLDAGERPEGIAIVARDLLPYRSVLRTHLRRLGVPFSAPFASGPLLPLGRRLGNLGRLLVDGPRSEIGRWIDLLRSPSSRRERASLGLVLSAAGAGRLESAAELDATALASSKSSARVALPRAPAPSTATDAASEEEDAETELNGDWEESGARQELPIESLREAVSKARKTREALNNWSKDLPFGDHRARLENLLRELGWVPADKGWDVVMAALGSLEKVVPEGFLIGREELARLLTRELEERGRELWGGSGGGIQVLSALHARSLTFDHLFVLGVNRGLFPRTISEDFLLPEGLRQALAGSGSGPLPDLALKREGTTEERYLFSQLLSAAPNVRLSWHAHDDEGKLASPSPLLARIQATSPPATDAEVTAHDADLSPLRPAFERVIEAATGGGLSALGALLPIAIREADEIFSPLSAEHQTLDDDADALARFRLGVLRAFEGESFRVRAGRLAALGPYHGAVGRPSGAKERDLYVTTLEELARCPWQVFIARLLKVEPIPDPLASLPALDPIWVGLVVHRTLERCVEPFVSGGGDLATIEGRTPTEIPWLEEEAIEAILREEAEALLRREGASLPGLAALLCAAAREPLSQARTRDWQAGPLAGVLGVEVTGSIPITEARSIFFRADRVDRSAEGLRLTDYKTGRPFARQKTPAGRLQELRRKVARGENLQTAVYARAAGPGGVGRYLYLDPDPELDPVLREVVVSAEDEETGRLAEGAILALAKAWEEGTLLPRLTNPQRNEEPRRCQWCRVAEACVRGDSSMRRQLFDWGKRALSEPPGSSPSADLWRLPLASGETAPELTTPSPEEDD